MSVLILALAMRFTSVYISNKSDFFLMNGL